MEQLQTHAAPPPQMVRPPLLLLSGFWACVVIAIAVVIRRLYVLLHFSAVNPASGRPAQLAALDEVFSSHAALTVAHIVPAAIFVVLAAVLLLRRTGTPWLEGIFFLSGVITGVTAYAMSAYAIGGWVELSAVFVYDTWFLFSLARAFGFRLQHDVVRQRVWMTRAVGILLGIATTRPVMGIFFSTSTKSHLTPRQFFGLAFWIGFSINAVVVELWLLSGRRGRLRERAA